MLELKALLLFLLAGSLYIDCGANASYVDPITGVTWVPDSGFISTGENFANVPTAKTVWQDYPELNTLRFFNNSGRAKNCYTLPVTINATYLLTASFLWASYDNSAAPPSFGFAIDGTILASVTLDTSGSAFDQLEFSIQPPSNVTYVCLTQLPSQLGTPFISALYLRPGPVYAYFDKISSRQMIRVRHRLNFGGTSTGRYVCVTIIIPFLVTNPHHKIPSQLMRICARVHTVACQISASFVYL